MIFFLALLFYISKAGSSRVTSGELLRYDFIRSDCLRGTIPQGSANQQVLGGLIVDRTNIICPPNNGVKLSSNIAAESVKDGLTSVSDLSLLLTNLKNKFTFTFGFWIDIGGQRQLSTSQALLAFSSTSPSSACQPFQVTDFLYLCNSS
jgi:hypothetical protein